MVVGVAPQQMRLPESFFANSTNHTLIYTQTEQGKFIPYIYPPNVKNDDPIGILIGLALMFIVIFLLTAGVCILISINRKLSSKNSRPSSNSYIPLLDLPPASTTDHPATIRLHPFKIAYDATFINACFENTTPKKQTSQQKTVFVGLFVF